MVQGTEEQVTTLVPMMSSQNLRDTRYGCFGAVTPKSMVFPNIQLYPSFMQNRSDLTSTLQIDSDASESCPQKTRCRDTPRSPCSLRPTAWQAPHIPHTRICLRHLPLLAHASSRCAARLPVLLSVSLSAPESWSAHPPQTRVVGTSVDCVCALERV